MTEAEMRERLAACSLYRTAVREAKKFDACHQLKILPLDKGGSKSFDLMPMPGLEKQVRSMISSRYWAKVARARIAVQKLGMEVPTDV